MLPFSFCCFLCSQMEMIPEPDPDDEGTKISVSWRTHPVSLVVARCLSSTWRRDPVWQRFPPRKHNSSWFPWIIHLQPEKGTNQWNPWQCIISVKVVPFLLHKAFHPLFPCHSACAFCAQCTTPPTTQRTQIAREPCSVNAVLFHVKWPNIKIVSTYGDNTVLTNLIVIDLRICVNWLAKFPKLSHAVS